MQPWFIELIEYRRREAIERYLVKQRRLPRLNEFGEFVWCWELALYFACIKPMQHAVVIRRLTSTERSILCGGKNRESNAVITAERIYAHRMAARRYYAMMTPAEKAAKIEAARQANPPKGRLRLDPEIAKQRKVSRKRKEAAKHYQRIKADPVRLAAYRERKNASRRLRGVE